ncbi:MAG: thioredoxin-disulfide reductase, partial [Gemmatimonadetes bacterium]|nr:thioredoxin-disulfide reductase [Gemmatimonadota bacterium]
MRQVVILGSGCAGYTAAIYAARANLKPLLVEGPEAGGQLSLTTEVENFPGFPEGIQGPELIRRMREQAERFGTEVMRGELQEADLSRRPFRLVAEGREVRTRALIVASGARARWLGLPREMELVGHGVSSCATCDGFFHRGREVGVVGGGDSAMEEAIFLTRFAARVHVIHRRAQLRASRIMQDRALANPRIEFAWNSRVLEYLGDGALEGVVLEDMITGATRRLPLSGLFVAIGHVPNTALFEGQLETDYDGYLLVHDGSLTNVPGVFAAGDVHDRHYRQAIT